MSYSVSLQVDLGGPEPSEIEHEYWNYTSNVAPMWRIAMPETDGLAGMHDMEAGEAAQALELGIRRMEAEPAPYRALEPANGWGDFESQLDRLKVLLGIFREHPKATVYVSR